MSGNWEKQNWIKDILAKAGNDLKDIKDGTDINKMVYNGYAIPLLMQTEQSSTQICTNPNADINNGRNTTTVAINYHQVPQTSSSQSTINHDQTNQQQSHHLIGGGGNNEEGQTFSSSNYQSPNGKLKPQFKCDQCHMNFGSKSAHTSHMKSHAKQFQTQNNMVVTANVVVPMQNGMSSGGMNVQPPAAANTNTTEPYQCDVCKKTFAVPARLVRHYRTHTGERPFACEFCHKTFSVKENLQVHRRIHTKERPYKCDVCGRAFEHSGKLHRHMRIHTGERPHKCSVCGKTFIQSGQLVIHMRTHTGEKPYKCPVEGCGKGFTCSKQLKVHSRTHTGEKPYHCDICFRDFGYNHVLKLHRVQHYGSKCYKCTICDETFKSKKDMEAHIKGHANDMPDDEDEQNDEQMVIIADNKHQQQRDSKSPMHIKHDEPIPLVTSPASTTNQMCITPKDSGSEANSDGDETNYYNMYSRFNSTNGNYHTQSGVNPALLAAASIAAAASAAGFDDQQRSVSTSPPASHMNISSNSNGSSNGSSAITIHAMQPPQNTPPQPTNSNFIYEPMVLMRQNGYFGQNSQSPEFKPSLVSANLVRHVEEAIAIAEPLLTPPRSSPESPDRSSSPESDSILMADRDIMSLPPRKRKLYLKDNQTTSDSSTAMRISSVIQFAKAS